MTEKNLGFSKPSFETFEEYKQWFKEFAAMLGVGGEPVSEEKMRETWLKLKEGAAQSQKGVEGDEEQQEEGKQDEGEGEDG